jgi:CBS domain containing-hemolysin-like protein
MDYHAEESAEGGTLNRDEVMVIKGALSMSEKTVKTILTPLSNVFMIDYDSSLDDNMMRSIVLHGHSRVPIYREERENIVGLLLVKSLILYDPDASTPISEVKLNEVLLVDDDTPVWSMLNTFQTGKSHMAIVKAKDTHEVIGVVTLEDIFEELIQEEIIDETDVMEQVEKRLTVADIFRKVAEPMRRTQSASVIRPQNAHLSKIKSMDISLMGGHRSDSSSPLHTDKDLDMVTISINTPTDSKRPSFDEKTL